MANNYHQWSETLGPLTQEEHDWIHERLADPDEDAPWYDLDAGGLGFDYSLEATVLHVYAEDVGNLETLGLFVQAFLAKFRPKDVWSISWANTCNKMRAGEFGGGAMVVSAKNIRFLGDYQASTLMTLVAKVELAPRAKRPRRARIQHLLQVYGFKDINELKKDVEDYGDSK